MALSLGQDWVDALNSALSDGTKFIKTVELTESPGNISYWADHEEAITYNGNTYTPLGMRWDDLKKSQGMGIEPFKISVSNLTGAAVRYIKQVDVTSNPVWIRLLHTKLLNSATVHWKHYGKVRAVQANVTTVTFTIGRDLGRNMQPNELFLAAEFPSLTSETPKILG